MNKELNNLKFSTKSVLLTENQKNTIESLIEELNDYDCDDYDNVKYWELSKQDASDLIDELMNKLYDLRYEIW